MCFSSLTRTKSGQRSSSFGSLSRKSNPMNGEDWPPKLSDGTRAGLRRIADDISSSFAKAGGVLPDVIGSTADAFVNLR
jgi:hypothetical protein